MSPAWIAMTTVMVRLGSARLGAVGCGIALTGNIHTKPSHTL
jgi:hypothetical protein